jgi:streptomycin 6-kinase
MNLQLSDRLTKAIMFARGADDGLVWLKALPRRIDHYLRRWNLAAVEIAEGGAMSCCIFCTTAEGRQVVLKIPFDAASGRLESRSLARWSEEGASPAVLASSPASGVFVMSRVQPGSTAVPTGRPEDSEHLCELISRMTSPRLGPMRGLRELDAVTAMRLEWAVGRFDGPGYDPELMRLPATKALLSELLRMTDSLTIIHGDLQSKNILVGPRGRWQAIDPFTCRGDINAEAALWAAPQDSSCSVEDRIVQLSSCPMLQVDRLRAWCYVYAVLEYRAYLTSSGQRMRAFTTNIDAQDLLGKI